MILIIEAAQTQLAPYAEGVQCGGHDVPSGEAPAYAGTISSSGGTAGLQRFSRLPHQNFADLHDRLNIGIVRRVPLELGGVWSKSDCEHLSGVEGGVHHSHEGRGRPRRTAANSA